MKRIRLLLLTALAVLTLCAAASAEEPSVTRYGESAAATASAPGGADNDELFYQYMLRQGRGDADEDLTGGSTGEHLAREGLSEDAQRVYDALAKRIEEIASGDGVSSLIAVPLTELGFTITYSSDYQLYEIGLKNSPGTAVTSAMLNSMIGSSDWPAIFRALLADMPYELYWLDKTKGAGLYEEEKLEYYSLSETAHDIVHLVNQENVYYYFFISQDYATKKSGDEYDLFKPNITLTKAAAEAAQYAKTIVNDNSGNSDYEKIKAYKEKICELVDYNNVAASNSGTTPYGDPWQLICVFDRDTETKVVCEGYAKAFQYLCDLTNFTSNQIQCYAVTGTMNGGTGAGNHMWNVVTMDDGKNYLVDVTNCDGNSVGAPEFLFLKGVTEDTDGYHVTIAEWREDLDDTHYIIHNAATVNYSYDDATKNTWAENILRPSAADYSPLDAATVDRVTLSLTGTAVKVGDVGVKGCVYLLGEYDGNGRLTRLQTVWNGTSKTVNEALNWSGSVESGRTVKLFLLDGTTFAPMKAALSPSAS